MLPECDRQFVAIQNIPSPYRIHLFRVLQDELASRGVRLHVHFMARGHLERPDTWRDPEIPFPHTYWEDYGWRTHHWNPGMVMRLRQGASPDCLLVGSSWDTFTGIAASFFVSRKKGILWTEGNTKTPGRLGGLLGWFKRLVLGSYDYVAVPGREGAGYVALHQRRASRPMPVPIVLPNLVDERRFRVRDQWPQQEIADVRGQLGVLSGQRLALCPARLEPVKGLVEFFERVPVCLLEGWLFVILGEGSLKMRLMSVIQNRGLSSLVKIVDYIPYGQMPVLYACSDLFVLPSIYDPNPLSVIEAMHSGLPLLLSKQVGNFPEALFEGVTGWGFSPFDEQELGRACQQAFTASPERLQMAGHASKVQAEKVWHSESAVRRFVETLGL